MLAYYPIHTGHVNCFKTADGEVLELQQFGTISYELHVGSVITSSWTGTRYRVESVDGDEGLVMLTPCY